MKFGVCFFVNSRKLEEFTDVQPLVFRLPGSGWLTLSEHDLFLTASLWKQLDTCPPHQTFTAPAVMGEYGS